MPWTILHGRERHLFVSSSRDGAAEFTQDQRQALKFASQDLARRWITANVVSSFGVLALMREPGEKDTRKGQAGHYGSRTNP